MMNKTHEKYFI